MMKTDIGTNAGKIWTVLAERYSVSIEQLSEMTGIKEPMFGLSLGWLARENKIAFSDRDGVMYVGLSHSVSDNYY